MTFKWNLYSVTLASLVFFVLLLNFSGLVHFETMMQAGDNMPRCPFAPGEVLCTMNIFGHINAWRGIFTSLPQKEFFNLCALFILAAAATVWLVRRLNHSLHELFFATRLSLSYTARISLPTFLEEAFSSGILHPKLF
jgi:CDP-diglyceride synthetase